MPGFNPSKCSTCVRQFFTLIMFLQWTARTLSALPVATLLCQLLRSTHRCNFPGPPRASTPRQQASTGTAVRMLELWLQVVVQSSAFNFRIQPHKPKLHSSSLTGPGAPHLLRAFLHLPSSPTQHAPTTTSMTVRMTQTTMTKNVWGPTKKALRVWTWMWTIKALPSQKPVCM